MSQINLDLACRLCGEEKGRMRAIFDRKQQHPLKQIIADIVRLNIEPDDGLPQKICRQCCVTLLKMQDTIDLFRTTDLRLRKGLMPFPYVDIKQEDEEEMEVETLEQICRQDLRVVNLEVEIVPEAGEDELKVKEERLECLEDELNDSGDVVEGVTSKEEIDGENDNHDVPDNDVDDADWQPTKDDIEEPQLIQEIKQPKKEKADRKRRRKGAVQDEDAPKRPRGRKGKKDPNRPKRYDYKCYICSSESLGSGEAFIAHLNEHKDQLPYKCSECVIEEVVINAVNTLNLHKKMHLNPLKCPMCDRRYTTKSNIQTHIEMYHTDKEPVTCELCGKLCHSKVYLRDHMKLHTSAAPCEYCGKIFKEKHKLKRHIEVRHKGLKNFECHLCQKKLASLDTLQTHITVMHSSLEFKCTICSRTYSSDLSLRAHMKLHQENPNYEPTKKWDEYYTVVEGEEGLKNGARLKKCHLCGELKTQIGSHLRSVHFPKEYRCAICSATFKAKERYEIHVLEHQNGAQAFKCPICGREFSEKKNLFSHLKTKQHRDHPLAKSLDWFVDHTSKELRQEATAALKAKLETSAGSEHDEDVEVAESVRGLEDGFF